MSDVATRSTINASAEVEAEPRRPAPESPWRRAVAAVEAIPGLDRVADGYAWVTRPLVARKPVADIFNGRWLGHAVHPVLSDIPLGFWSAVPLLDLAGDDDAARLLTGAGVLAGFATAATGAADWSTTYGRDRRLGVVHGLTNGAGLLVQTLAWNARRRGRRGAGRALSVAGLGIAAAAAYLGGEMVFGRAWMVDRTTVLHGPDRWTPALDSAALREGQTAAADVDGRKVLLTRRQGFVRAVEATCSHAGGPLDEGTIEKGVVTCPWHGSRFDVADGTCLAGPATFPQPRLQTREAEGRIEVKGSPA